MQQMSFYTFITKCMEVQMSVTKSMTNEQKKQAAAEDMWLSFYNNVLFEKGLISEDIRSRMAVKISARNPCMREFQIRHR